jgi:hypothetical protein
VVASLVIQIRQLLVQQTQDPVAVVVAFIFHLMYQMVLLEPQALL